MNPAPAPSQDISDILRHVDVLCPNKREAESLTGVEIRSMDDAERASDRLRETGVKSVVLTLGAEGLAAVFDEGQSRFVAGGLDAEDSQWALSEWAVSDPSPTGSVVRRPSEKKASAIGPIAVA